MSSHFEKLSDEIMMATLLVRCKTTSCVVSRELFARRFEQLKSNFDTKYWRFTVPREFFSRMEGSSADEATFQRACLVVAEGLRRDDSPQMASIILEVLERYMASKTDEGMTATLRLLKPRSGARGKK